MERSSLIFEYSPWFVLVCLLIGAVVTLMLYRVKGPWSRTVHYLLTVLRFLLISAICFLLIGPIVKQFKNRVEKPHYVLAIDNSQSLAEVIDSIKLKESLSNIKSLGQDLESSGYQVEYRSLEQKLDTRALDTLRFDHSNTALHNLLKSVQTDYEGKNLTGVVLFSDGIHNQGLSPVFVPYGFPVHSMGLGDTIPQRDVSLKAIHYNKIAYQGNQFIIRAEILNEGFLDQQVAVSVSEGNRILNTKRLNLTSSPQLLEANFQLDAKNTGLKDFRVTIAPVNGEFSPNNNFRHAYIEIIEGRRKILLAASSPHPDIKAIKSSIEKNEIYQVEIFIPGISEPQSDTYDLLILHQIGQQEIKRTPKVAHLVQIGTPIWTILGSNSNINRFNAENTLVAVKTINFQNDLVTPSLNSAFSKFDLSTSLQQDLADYNPVSVPFANYQLSGGAEVLLYQKVGNLITENPLLIVLDDGDRKTAAMLGEGIWQWRLQDYSKNQNFEAFDELITKLVQYLSSAEDRSRFKVYPVTSEFSVNEPAILETEAYNEIYEKTYGHAIELDLNGPNGFRSNYSYVTSLGNSKYRLTELAPGIYTFTASTTIDGQPVQSQGQFTVTEIQLEALNLTADHQLLRSLSVKTNGTFFRMEDWDSLKKHLVARKAQGILFSEEAFTPLIKWPWALGLLLLLVSLEWFLRKYYGSY